MHPVPAAVTPCLHSESTTSPAAKIPSIDVSGLPDLQAIYPLLSNSILLPKNFVFGVCPIA